MDDLFFIVSKVIWGLLSPGCLFVWLVVLTAIFSWMGYRRAANRLLLLLSVAGISLMAYPVGDYLMYPLEKRVSRPETRPQHIDGIIVLGGAEQLKLSESWNSTETGEGAERIIVAAKLAQEYPEVPIIYSGGSNLIQMPTLDVEGSISRSLLNQVGIDDERIVIEPTARNTYENFVRIKPLLPKAEGQYLLVTSAFHMPRAVGIANQQHIKIIPYPVDYRSQPPEFRQWDFDLFEHLNVLETAWHEWLGLTVYFVTQKTTEWFPGHSMETQPR